jgi:Plasmid maintenance system antidote protein
MQDFAEIRNKWFIMQVRALESAGTPQAEVARQIGVKPQYLTPIISGKRNASEKLVKKLCEAFGINQNDLVKQMQSYDKEHTTHAISEEPKGTKKEERKLIPMYDDAISIGGMQNGVANVDGDHTPTELIDAGDWFPDATAAIRHYGDSMDEYPSGCILVLKRVNDLRLIIWGRNYLVETTEYRITKQLQDGGELSIVGYSSNKDTYPDGRQIHSPIYIPKDSIRYIYQVIGCVTKEYSNGAIPIR